MEEHAATRASRVRVAVEPASFFQTLCIFFVICQRLLSLMVDDHCTDYEPEKPDYFPLAA